MINNQLILAVVMAREGSVGLPGKSTKLLLGIPSFMWSVIYAMQSKYIDYIVISCSCELVAKSWNDYLETNKNIDTSKVIYLNRDKKLSLPSVKNEPVLINAYTYARENYNVESDIIVNLQSTSPLRYNNLIDTCIEKFAQDDADSLLTVSKIFPFIWYQHGRQAVCPNNYFKNRPMRQDIKEEDFSLIDNGNIYITKKDILLKDNNRLGGKITTYVTDKFQSLQIDDIEDFELIEQIAKNKGIAL